MYGKVIKTDKEFESLKDIWEILQENDDDVTYYNTFKYNFLLWNEFKKNKDKELFTIVIYNNSEVVGIAPFMLVNKKKATISYKVLEFITWGDFRGIILDRRQCNELKTIKEIFNVIEENSNLWDKINLSNISSNSKLAAYLFQSIKYNKFFTYLIENPRIYIDKYCNFEEFKQKNTTSHAKKYRNKLLKEVGYKFCVMKNNENDVYEDISYLHKIEQKYLYTEYKRKDRRSLFENKEKNEFIKKLYLKNANVITFLIKTNDDEILAYKTCYLYKKVLYSWNTAFNPKYEKYRLGKITNYELIKYVFENNIAKISDFGAGRYPWKFEWTSDFVTTYKLEMWNNNYKKDRMIQKLLKVKHAIKELK